MIDYYKKTAKVIRRIDKLEQKQFMTHKQRHWNRYKISKLRSRFNLYTKLNVKQLQDAKLNNYTALVNDIIVGAQ